MTKIKELTERIMDAVHDAMIDAEVDYPAGREAGSSVTIDSAGLAHIIEKIITHQGCVHRTEVQASTTQVLTRDSHKPQIMWSGPATVLQKMHRRAQRAEGKLARFEWWAKHIVDYCESNRGNWHLMQYAKAALRDSKVTSGTAHGIMHAYHMKEEQKLHDKIKAQAEELHAAKQLIPGAILHIISCAKGVLHEATSGEEDYHSPTQVLVRKLEDRLTGLAHSMVTDLKDRDKRITSQALKGCADDVIEWHYAGRTPFEIVRDIYIKSYELFPASTDVQENIKVLDKIIMVQLQLRALETERKAGAWHRAKAFIFRR